jgi:hypothetical protein
MFNVPRILNLLFSKGQVIIYGGGWHRREMFSFVKILLIQPLKSLKKFTQPQISTKNKYPPLAENLQKDIIQLSHLSLPLL